MTPGLMLGAAAGASCTWGSGDSALIDASGYSNNNWSAATGNTWWGQTITIPTSGSIITGCKIMMGDSNGSGSLVVELRDQTTGDPGSNVLATATIGNADIPISDSPAFVDVEFSSPYTTTSDNQLLSITGRAIDGPVYGGYFTLRYQSSGNPMSGGALHYSLNAGSSWTERSNCDALSSIWGCTP